ncbi:uncharacterized protein LOC131874329 [Cryptomeria japonica]|uniref:uncharacterized protein LOC131874329 n=1 Tax=Cryptomeria japonica TaxID=3369 RepID=UPI0027D9F71F|nr:uncharacterized protein LOC131874329 [Cryptomeria japonica]
MAHWWRVGGPTYGTAMFSFSKKLQYVKRKLKNWNKNCFGNLYIMNKRAQERLVVITRKIRDLGFFEALSREESQASRDLEEWDLREEIYCKQKARIDWVQEGDKNTVFFHKSVQGCQNRSYISSLVNSDDLHLASFQAISREAIRFYSTLFLEDSLLTDNEENIILSCIPSLVSRAMNDSLMRLISMSKLEEVVFSMHKGKALRPDGFLVKFFQEFWGIISQDLLVVVQESHSNK